MLLLFSPINQYLIKTCFYHSEVCTTWIAFSEIEMVMTVYMVPVDSLIISANILMFM